MNLLRRFRAKPPLGTLHASVRSLPLGRFTPSLLFLLVFLTVLTLYFLTLAPGVVGGDAGEHQFAAPLLGIPHTTGYPLYILLGKLWTLLIPFGSMAWRMNLFSALGGALAAAITALIVYYLSANVSRVTLSEERRRQASRFRAKPPLGTHHISSFITCPREGVHPSSFASAFIAGLTLAVGLTLWQWSIIAGVRSITILFFALLTLEAIIWQRHMEEWKHGGMEQWRKKESDSIPNQPSNLPTFQPSDPPSPYWLALTVGLSLAHHRTTLFYLPSLIAWIGWHDRQLIRQPKRLLTLAFLSLAPLLLYLFTYFRGVNNPPYSHEQITDWSSFWFLIGSGDSSGLFFSIDPAFLPARLAFIWRDLLVQLSWPGVILAALGGLWLLWRQPRHFFFQAPLVLLLLIFTLDFEVVNLNEAPTWYLMPAYFILAVWVGLGVNGIWDMGYGIWVRNRNEDKSPFTIQSQRSGPQRPRPPVGNSQFTIHNSLSPSIPFSSFHRVIPHIFTLAIIAILGYFLAWPNWQTLYTASVAPLDDWRQLLRGTQTERFVESSLPYVKPHSIIWGDWEQYTPLKYYQLIHGWRTDVTVRNPLDRWPEKVVAARAANQPVYFTRKPTDLIGTPYLTMVGPLIYLQTAPQLEAPPHLIPLNANFEDELELIGYHIEIWPQSTMPPPPRRRANGAGEGVGPILQLMLYWRSPHSVQWDYALSLRLLDSTGQEIYKKDAAHPVLSSYPTTLWTPGEVVGDFYELPLPLNTGPLTLHLLPYRTEGPGQWHNLTLNGVELAQEGIRLKVER